MVPAASGAVGVRVAMVPAALSATVAGTLAAAPAARRVKLAVVIVAAFTGLLNVAETVVLRGTPVGKSVGAGESTDRGGGGNIKKKAGPSGGAATAVTVAATGGGENVARAQGV